MRASSWPNYANTLKAKAKNKTASFKRTFLNRDYTHSASLQWWRKWLRSILSLAQRCLLLISNTEDRVSFTQSAEWAALSWSQFQTKKEYIPLSLSRYSTKETVKVNGVDVTDVTDHLLFRAWIRRGSSEPATSISRFKVRTLQYSISGFQLYKFLKYARYPKSSTSYRYVHVRSKGKLNLDGQG